MANTTEDFAHKAIDRHILTLDKKLHREYAKALKQMENEANKYLIQFKTEDAVMRKKFIMGTISKKDYIAWRQRKILEGKRYDGLINQLASDLSKTNELACITINKSLPESFIVAANYSAYEIERTLKGAVSFGIYNKDAVAELLKENPVYLPKASIDFPKDIRWNKQKINSALVQGILQGESIGKIAKRLMFVTDMNEHSSRRNARTLHTAAESIGRIDSYKRAEKMGIDMQNQWITTHDNRSRDAHRELDGQIKNVGEAFWNSIGKIRYPSDPQAHPTNVYNCRCSLRGVIKGHPYKTDRFSGADYEAWKKGKIAYAEYLRSGHNG